MTAKIAVQHASQEAAAELVAHALERVGSLYAQCATRSDNGRGFDVPGLGHRDGYIGIVDPAATEVVGADVTVVALRAHGDRVAWQAWFTDMTPTTVVADALRAALVPGDD